LTGRSSLTSADVEGRRDFLIVAALALAVFAQAVPNLVRESLTFYELTYVPSGYSYWVTGDYRLNPEYPPLSKLLAGSLSWTGRRLAGSDDHASPPTGRV